MERRGVLVFLLRGVSIHPHLISSWLVSWCVHSSFHFFSMCEAHIANTAAALHAEERGAGENESASEKRTPAKRWQAQNTLFCLSRSRRVPPSAAPSPLPRLPRGRALALGARSGPRVRSHTPSPRAVFFFVPRPTQRQWSALCPPSSRATPRRRWGGRSRQRECVEWGGVARREAQRG